MKKSSVKNNVVLVDGLNMMFRVGYVNSSLTNNEDPVGMLFGFMKSMIAIWTRWYNAQVVVVWDSKSKRRLEESKKAIEEGVLTTEQGFYKSNRIRKDDERDELYNNIKMQEDTLHELLSYTLAKQIRVDGYEADDVIGTLSLLYEKNNRVFIVSSDKDFYQLLSDNINIFNSFSDEVWSLERFRCEFGIEPNQWIDVGALSGDKGDNIIGVKGVGIKTAIKLIDKFKTIEGVFDGLKKQKKLKKVEERILESYNLVKLAYSLKKIDRDVEGLSIRHAVASDGLTLKKRFNDLDFKSLMNNVSLLTRRAI